MHPILKGGIARGLALVPTALATLGASHFVLDHYGTEVFNGFVLVMSSMALIPFNSLGIGASLTSSVAARGAQDPLTRRVALTAARYLTLSCFGFTAVVLVITALGLWPDLLGDSAASGTAFGIALLVFALSFVPGLGSSLLLGANKNHLVILSQGFYAPTILLLVLLAELFDLGSSFVLVAPAISFTAVAVGMALLSWIQTRFPWPELLRQLPRRRHPGASIRAMAGPALITNLTVPLMVHSDRLVLSHLGTRSQLAEYSIAWQLYAAVPALITSAAQPIWPMFEKARADGTEPPNLGRLLALFCAVAGIAGLVLLPFADRLGSFVGGEQIDLGLALPATMVAALVVQAMTFPLAMALMEPVGLRLMARLCLIALPVNLALSMLLTGPLGAPGPLLASILVAVFVQGIPALVHLRRRGHLAPTTVPEGVPPPVPLL
ncbi:MAG TPA: hypothetical protein VJ804_15570 [Acidimicrobiales bacterium]|nr:hypothetical protein [Acidimicrobiales bacterium]